MIMTILGKLYLELLIYVAKINWIYAKNVHTILVKSIQQTQKRNRDVIMNIVFISALAGLVCAIVSSMVQYIILGPLQHKIQFKLAFKKEQITYLYAPAYTLIAKSLSPGGRTSMIKVKGYDRFFIEKRACQLKALNARANTAIFLYPPCFREGNSLSGSLCRFW